jgi:hypothetical protein
MLNLHDFRTRYKRFFLEEEGRSYAAKTLEDLPREGW